MHFPIVPYGVPDCLRALLLLPLNNVSHYVFLICRCISADIERYLVCGRYRSASGV